MNNFSIDPDLAAKCGIDVRPSKVAAAVRARINQPASRPDTASTGTKPLKTFTPLGELLKSPPAENWLVKRLIPASSIVVFFGNSGHGKTFVVIDLLCHIAAGLEWCSNKTRKGPILYLAGEGQHGICLLYTSPSPRDRTRSRMPSSA